MLVWRCNSSVRRLTCLGSRCWMKTNAMPVLDGRAWSISVKASRPPAEAPIPTIGKTPSSDWSGSSATRGGKEGRGSREEIGDFLVFFVGRLAFFAVFFFSMESSQSHYHPAKVYLRTSRWTRRQGIMAINRSPQRRKVNRNAGDRRVVRVETKDYLGHPRYITADLLDSSDVGLGLSLRTPLEAGASLVIRTNLDPKRANVPRRVLVNWCEEKPDGTFQAGLQFV